MDLNNQSLFSENELNALILPDSKESENIIKWLAQLYDLTDWRSLLLNNEFLHEYNGISILCFFKAFALPYLIKISSSERELGRLIIDRVNLQKLCGFRAGYPNFTENQTNKTKPIIGVRSLWHFRTKFANCFTEMMIKTLILLVLSGESGNFDLPFVEIITENEFNEEGNIFNWYLDYFRSPITISFRYFEEDLKIKEKNHKFIHNQQITENKLKINNKIEEKKNPELLTNGEINNKSKLFPEMIRFPINVKVRYSSGECLYFRLIETDFSKSRSIFINRPSHQYIMNKLERLSYDNACNILVIREKNGIKEILLSRKYTKKGEPGSYTVPGGKQEENESLEQCAIRELSEETGLQLFKSNPVSLYWTKQPTTRTFSVGVLAQKWSGIPKTREPKKHVGWDWFNLDYLPDDLIRYTRIAINQYTEKIYQGIKWRDLEEKYQDQFPIFE